MTSLSEPGQRFAHSIASSFDLAWIIQVKSKEEAIEWARRCPAKGNEVIEIRQIQEMSDFPEDVQKATAKFDQAKGAVRPTAQ